MDIVEAGEGWLAISKPAGLSVFPLHTDPNSDCVLARLLVQCPELAQGFPEGFSGGIAHRLDIPTSGMLLVAKSPEQLDRLRNYFKARQWKKKYIFLSAHRASWNEKYISDAIAHHPKNRRKMVVQKSDYTSHRGKWYRAETHFKYLGAWRYGHAYQATMRTGVMHQIRVHAATLGIPLIGDTLYKGGDSPAVFSAAFALHHSGMTCPDIQPKELSVPEWWPKIKWL